jgi:hypothetical protein
MKRYIHIALIALFAQCGLSNVMYAMETAPTTEGDDAIVNVIKIAPITMGDDAIVNAIKQYSNLTEVDVNQYKLLWLRSLGTTGAFLAGAISTIGAGVGAYQQAGVVQSITPERIPSWMTNALVLAGLGSAGTSYVSYKLLYPRIREGVLVKVNKLEQVYESLKSSSIGKKNINIQQIKEKLPAGWGDKGDVAVYNALMNLIEQGRCANTLLGQINLYEQKDDIEQRIKQISTMIEILEGNKEIYDQFFGPIKAKEIKEEDERRKKALKIKKAERKEKRVIAETADLEASANLKQQGAGLAKAKTIETYGQMFTDAIKNTWSGLNYIYKNKEKIVYRGSILAAGAYGMYVAAKAKLGFGQ